MAACEVDVGSPMYDSNMCHGTMVVKMHKNHGLSVGCCLRRFDKSFKLIDDGTIIIPNFHISN